MAFGWLILLLFSRDESHFQSNKFCQILALIELASKLPELSFNSVGKEEGLDIVAAVNQQMVIQEQLYEYQ